MDPGGILYIDGSNRLQVATYTASDGLLSQGGDPVSYSSVIYAKFGSTIGFTHTGTNDTWDSGDVKFNPPGATYATSAAGYTSIPCWQTWGGTRTNADGFVSSSTYHTLTYVKAGFGDICQLVGYSASEVRGLSALPTSPTWRLPTTRENQLLVGDPTSFYMNTSVSPRVMTFDTGYELPALGRRSWTNGAANGWGTGGFFWSSYTYNETDCLEMEFLSGRLMPTFTTNVHMGLSIRCVKFNP